MLDAHRHAHHVGGDACRLLLLLAELLVRRRCRMDHERLCVADVRKVARQLHAVDEPDRLLKSALDAEGQHASESMRQIFLRQLVRRMILQTGIVHPRNRVVRLEPAGQFKRVVEVALHAKRERFEALQKHEGVEGADRRAKIAQPLDSRPDDEGKIADRFVELQTVIAFRRLGEERKLAVAPIERSGIDDDAAHRGAVPADPLGCGFYDDGCAVVEGTAKIARAAEGVIDDQRNAVFAGDGGDGLEVGHVERRVADRLHVERLRVAVDSAAKRLGIVAIHKLHLDAEALEGDLELVVGAAVEIARRDDVVARLADGGDGDELRRVAARHAKRRLAPFERRHALFEHVGGRVHQARIDVARLAQREQIRAMLGVLEHVRGGLIDGHGP